MPMRLMVPFGKIDRPSAADCHSLIVYARPADDFQSACLLFARSLLATVTSHDVAALRAEGASVCYVYDMLDLENREFTESGYIAINRDIRRAIEWGFTHMLVSNAYIIELLANEYADSIRVIVSSQLECNSDRARVFFDVLNDTRSITHVVISQNHLTPQRFLALKAAFRDMEIVVEVDRWISDVQMVHEHYYNIVYGYDHPRAVDELRAQTHSDGIRRYVRGMNDFLWGRDDVTYKIGELNASADLVGNNIQAVIRNDPARLRVVDFELW